MLIAQISDLHIAMEGHLAYERFDTASCVSRCIECIGRLRPQPDVVLATGDLVDSGSSGEYKRLRDVLAPLAVPVFLIPGNHDDREALRTEFRDHAYLPSKGRPACYAVEQYPVRLLALDTLVPGEKGGALGDGQLDWFEEQLASAPRRPTLVFLHHPPFRTGIPRMDDIGLDAASAQRLGDIVSRHSQIELVTAGHLHRGLQTRWRGTTASVCPSAAFQFRLNMEPAKLEPAPNEPPAYQLHCWNGSELVTHTVSISDRA
jgi:3',5'-cyclic AMP phosphodiesterase CpdA